MFFSRFDLKREITRRNKMLKFRVNTIFFMETHSQELQEPLLNGILNAGITHLNLNYTSE